MVHSWHSSFSPATHVLTQMSPRLVIHCSLASDHIFLPKPFLTKSPMPSLLLNPTDSFAGPISLDPWAAFDPVDTSCLETIPSLTLLLSSCFSGSLAPVSMTDLSSCRFGHPMLCPPVFTVRVAPLPVVYPHHPSTGRGDRPVPRMDESIGIGAAHHPGT